MAAFTSRDPNDRDAFDAHMARVRSAPDVTNRAITRDGRLIGSIASFVIEGDTEITYWIDRSAWGQGVASQALTLFLQTVQIRPLHARAASDNAGSQRVLHKAGFRITGPEVSYANARGYWFWGRPSFAELWHDLRAVSSEIRPDWDVSTPGLREAWDSGDHSAARGSWTTTSPGHVRSRAPGPSSCKAFTYCAAGSACSRAGHHGAPARSRSKTPGTTASLPRPAVHQDKVTVRHRADPRHQAAHAPAGRARQRVATRRRPSFSDSGCTTSCRAAC